MKTTDGTGSIQVCGQNEGEGPQDGPKAIKAGL